MKKNLICLLALMTVCVCQAEDINIHFDGATAKVKQNVKDSVNVIVNGANVNIESLFKAHKLTISVTGKSDDGKITLKSAGKAKVRLDGLNLTSQEGAPLDLRNKKKVEVEAVKGTENTLTITACNDTANHKAAVIWAKDKLLLSGKGTLNIIATGDGCRGIKTKKDITIEDLTLNVTTSGDNLGEKPVCICDSNGKLIDKVTVPFSLRRSASLVGSPAFKIGNSYTVKTKGYEKTFTFNEPFTIVR